MENKKVHSLFLQNTTRFRLLLYNLNQTTTIIPKTSTVVEEALSVSRTHFCDRNQNLMSLSREKNTRLENKQTQNTFWSLCHVTHWRHVYSRQREREGRLTWRWVGPVLAFSHKITHIHKLNGPVDQVKSNNSHRTRGTLQRNWVRSVLAWHKRRESLSTNFGNV